MQILYVFLSLCLYAECMKEKAHYLSLDNQSKKVSKRRIINSGLGRGEDLLLDRFDQNHCINKFETSSQTVILAKESQDNGAFFINETAAYSYKSCFKNCCETLGCNTAVWDQNTNFCYLFDCGSREDFKCYFDSHNMFTSGLLRVERSDLDMESRDYHRTHLQSLNPTRDQYSILQDEEGEAVKEECGRYQFQCHSGECVAIYDVCNGIPQCRDASDEDPQECPSTTPATIRTTPLPSTLKTLFPVSPERTQNNYRMEPSLFHHKNAGIQVANNAPYAYQPILNQPFGYSYYGKPMNALPNPPPDKPPQVLPPSLSSLPTKDEITKSNKKTLDPNRSNNNGTFSNIDRTSVSKKKTPTDLAGNLATNDSLDKIEQIKNSLIKDLKDVDLVMETPSAAIFTLIIGMSLSLVLVIVLACKIRARRNFFGVKRNVMTDADGDYLVNGMYL